MPAGAFILRRKLRCRYTGGYAFFYGPQHGIVVVIGGFYIGKGHFSAYYGFSGCTIEEGHDLCTGAACVGSKVRCVNAVYYAVIIAPNDGVVIEAAVYDIDKGNGESILIYAAYEKKYKDKAGEIRAASYFWNDRLIGVGVTYLGPVEGEDRAQEVALAENMLRNVEIIH